jgi:hypothetical protein
MAKSRAALSAPVCPPDMIFLSMSLILIVGLNLFEFREKFLLSNKTFVNQKLAQGIDLNRICHQEFLERYEFRGIEFLGHDESPGGISGNHIKAVGIGQTN